MVSLYTVHKEQTFTYFSGQLSEHKLHIVRWGQHRIGFWGTVLHCRQSLEFPILGKWEKCELNLTPPVFSISESKTNSKRLELSALCQDAPVTMQCLCAAVQNIHSLRTSLFQFIQPFAILSYVLNFNISSFGSYLSFWVCDLCKYGVGEFRVSTALKSHGSIDVHSSAGAQQKAFISKFDIT